MTPHRATLALCIAALLLSACASGGGTRSTPAPAAPPPPTSPPPPPPPPTPAVRTIDEGLLHVQGYLRSDVVIGAKGVLVLDGTIEGNVTNNGAGEFMAYNDPVPAGLVYLADGNMAMGGVVIGNVVNNGRMTLDGNLQRTGRKPPNRIEGDFRQTTAGTLGVPLPWGDGAVSYPLSITGRADIQGGTLWLYRVCDCWDLPAQPLPTQPVGVHVLHADRGVSGRFDQWISPGLFIEGAVRYETNDVWFDLNRVSIAAAAQASGLASSLAVASGANIDSALTGADGFVGMPPPSLDLAQRQFLASASSLLWMQDSAQAARALESLAGHAHVSVREQLHAQVVDSSSQLDARMSDLAYSARPLAWSQALANTPGSQRFQGAAGGIDQWLSPRLVVGAGIGDGRSTLSLDSMGGQASGTSPIASLYAHYRGQGWHATGRAGAGRATVRMQRPIETGALGLHTAHSQRVLDHAFAHGEIGRDIALAGGRLVPFAAVDYMDVRSQGFAEQGDTGFELIGAAQAQAQLSGSLGARYAQQWRFGRSAVRLDLGASYRHDLLDPSDPLRAAFRGVPDTWFEVPGQRAGGVTELSLRLGGALGRRWNWSMDYVRSPGNEAYDDYQVGLQRAF